MSHTIDRDTWSAFLIQLDAWELDCARTFAATV